MKTRSEWTLLNTKVVASLYKFGIITRGTIIIINVLGYPSECIMQIHQTQRIKCLAMFVCLLVGGVGVFVCLLGVGVFVCLFVCNDLPVNIGIRQNEIQPNCLQFQYLCTGDIEFNSFLRFKGTLSS